LAGISVHQPEMVLKAEPRNHLDLAGRAQLYDPIQNSKPTILPVRHDRQLLHQVDTVRELSKQGIKPYGEHYGFYTAQQDIEHRAVSQELNSKEKVLRKAKEKEREPLERLQKADRRGKGKKEIAGVARIMLNSLRNKAENS